MKNLSLVLSIVVGISLLSTGFLPISQFVSAEILDKENLDYEITGGTGRFANAIGSGEVHSVVNHCDDTFTGHLLGTIEYNASDRSG